MSETHPLDPPPSNICGVQNKYRADHWASEPEEIKDQMLGYLYERLAVQQRVPVGVVEGGYVRQGESVLVRMRVPTAPLLMDFAEHMGAE